MLIKNCRLGLIASALLFAVAGLSVAGVPAGKTAGKSGRGHKQHPDRNKRAQYDHCPIHQIHLIKLPEFRYSSRGSLSPS